MKMAKDGQRDRKKDIKMKMADGHKDIEIHKDRQTEIQKKKNREAERQK